MKILLKRIKEWLCSLGVKCLCNEKEKPKVRHQIQKFRLRGVVLEDGTEDIVFGSGPLPTASDGSDLPVKFDQWHVHTAEIEAYTGQDQVAEAGTVADPH